MILKMEQRFGEKLVDIITLVKEAKLDILGPLQTEIGLHTEAEGLLEFDQKGPIEKIVYVPRAVPSEEVLKCMEPYSQVYDFCSRKKSGHIIELPAGTRLEAILYTPYVYLPSTNFSMTDFLQRNSAAKDDLKKEDIPDVYGFMILLDFVKRKVDNPGFFQHSNRAKDIRVKLSDKLGKVLCNYLKNGEGEFNILSDKSSWPWYVTASTKIGVETVRDRVTFAKYVFSGIAKQKLGLNDIKLWQERTGENKLKKYHMEHYSKSNHLYLPLWEQIIMDEAGIDVRHMQVAPRTRRKYFLEAKKKYGS